MPKLIYNDLWVAKCKMEEHYPKWSFSILSLSLFMNKSFFLTVAYYCCKFCDEFYSYHAKNSSIHCFNTNHHIDCGLWYLLRNKVVLIFPGYVVKLGGNWIFTFTKTDCFITEWHFGVYLCQTLFQYFYAFSLPYLCLHEYTAFAFIDMALDSLSKKMVH